jgi:hypothetical protein
MQLTRKCAGCGESFRKTEMVEYFSQTGKTSHWYCPKCLEEKQARERFSNKVCQIFGIKAPGPVIWTQRKRLQNEYGYTDDAIVDCLDYIYHVQHKKILAESLVLVGPRSMAQMKAWRADKKARAGSIAAAIANTETKEYIVPIKENTHKRKEINLDDALLD